MASCRRCRAQGSSSGSGSGGRQARRRRQCTRGVCGMRWYAAGVHRCLRSERKYSKGLGIFVEYDPTWSGPQLSKLCLEACTSLHTARWPAKRRDIREGARH